MPRKSHPVARRRALRTIAVFEAVKGVAALAASLGLLRLLRHDLHRVVVDFIGHLGLDPTDRYPSMVLQYADLLAGTNVISLVLLVTGYVLLRSFEAYGLWHERAWGEWLGALSGALYIPFELRHVMLHPHLVGAAVLGLNVLIVAFLAHQLWRGRHSGRS